MWGAKERAKEQKKQSVIKVETNPYVVDRHRCQPIGKTNAYFQLTEKLNY